MAALIDDLGEPALRLGAHVLEIAKPPSIEEASFEVPEISFDEALSFGFCGRGRVIEAGGNAHGRRRFRDAEATQPVLAVEGGAFIAAMYAAENKAQELRLSGDDLRAHRQRHIRPVIPDFERWLDAVQTDPPAVRAAGGG